MERRLTAILLADVVEYSRLIGRDERRTLDAIRSIRKDVIEPAFERRNGRIVKLMGDGLLGEFASIVDAVSAALDIQQEMLKAQEGTLPEHRIAFQIGVSVGDVVFEDGDIFGDGVNIAARLQEISAPNGIAVSQSAHRELGGKLTVEFEDAGLKFLNNIVEPVHTWMWPANQSTNSPPDEKLLIFDSL